MVKQVILCSVVAALAAANHSQVADVSDLARRLRSNDPQEHVRVYDDAYKTREAEEILLIQIAATKKAKYELNDERTIAVKMLGDMRSYKSIRTLLAEIEYKVQEGPDGEWSPIRGYPCAEALRKSACRPSPKCTGTWHLRMRRRYGSRNGLICLCAGADLWKWAR